MLYTTCLLTNKGKQPPYKGVPPDPITNITFGVGPANQSLGPQPFANVPQVPDHHHHQANHCYTRPTAAGALQQLASSLTTALSPHQFSHPLASLSHPAQPTQLQGTLQAPMEITQPSAITAASYQLGQPEPLSATQTAVPYVVNEPSPSYASPYTASKSPCLLRPLYIYFAVNLYDL